MAEAPSGSSQNSAAARTRAAQAFRRCHQIFRQAVTAPQSLLSWRALNTILATQRLNPPRPRLSRDGITLRQGEYSTTVIGRRTVVWHRLTTGKLHRPLAEGATLVVDAIDEIHPPIGELAASLERRLRTGVTGITNAPSEEINRLIKTDARSAFGYRNPANQRLRACCATTRRARGLLPTTHTSGRHSRPRRQHVQVRSPIFDGSSSAEVADVPRAAWIAPSRTGPIVLNDAPTAKAAAFSRYLSRVPPEFR